MQNTKNVSNVIRIDDSQPNKKKIKIIYLRSVNNSVPSPKKRKNVFYRTSNEYY